MLFVTHMKSPREQPTVIRSAGSVWTYLPDGRWIERIAATNNGSTYCPAGTNRYVWDGQLLLAILDSALSLQTSFAWGLDLSGTVDGAGGVGGLLSATVPTGPNAGTYFYAYDGNGNVMALVNAADGSVAARYEYGPFGELLRATGPMAKANPFRFSTKYQDDETGLLYYGYRYYNPGTGGWVSRDSYGELGSEQLNAPRSRKGRVLYRGSAEVSQEPNLYAFVKNGPTGMWDKDGCEIGYRYTPPCDGCVTGPMSNPINPHSPAVAMSCGIAEALRIITGNFQRTLDESIQGLDSPQPSECVKKVLRDAYNHLKKDIWGGASDAEKHCRISCAMARANPRTSQCIGELNEYLDSLASKLGLPALCEARDLQNNYTGICCAQSVKKGKYNSCEECCRAQELK